MKFKGKVVGIRVGKTIGIGDAIQFTSVPENYFRHVGEKLADIEHNWVFDHNPYVIRNVQKVDVEIDLWRSHCLDVPKELNGRKVLLSNAEAHARHFNYPIVLNRPRLYKFEEFPFQDRTEITLHTTGRSHGRLPNHIVEHVLRKYKKKVTWISPKDELWDYPFEQPETFQCGNMWDLVEKISKTRMFIGVDSGPSWIAQCFPDVVTKKVRLFPELNALHSWVPLEWCRIGSHWDDRSSGIYNISENDVGFTWSYKRL